MSDQIPTIRIPYYMVKTVNKLMRTQRQLRLEYGREPTPKDIALEMGDFRPKTYRRSKRRWQKISAWTRI